MNKLFLVLLAAVLALSVGLVGCGASEFTLTIGSPTGGSTDPAPGAHVYMTGDVVDLEATADEGYVFLGWTGETDTVADVSDATTTITMQGDYFIEASFQQIIVPTSALIGPQGFPADPSLTPQYGGTLIHLHTGGSPSNIGAPYAAGSLGRDRPLCRIALEMLLGLGPDGELVPQLATDWELDSSAKTFTFTLRQGVKFHDGTAFNAEAAKWNLDMYAASTNIELQFMTACDVIDPYTIRLTFSEWNESLIRAFESTSVGMMISPTYAQAHTEAEVKLHPVGTGPFEFKELIPGTSVEFVAFDDYWQEGLPYLDGIVVKFVSDSVVRLTAFLNEEGDVIHEISIPTAQTLKAEGYDVGGRVVHLKGICMDTTEGSDFADINVRRAIAHAIPTAQLMADVFDGEYPALNQIALPGLNGYDSTIVGYDYDPVEARALMTAAGYSATNRLQTKLEYSTHDLDDYVTVLKDLLADVWIDIDLQFNSAFRGQMRQPWSNYMKEFQFSYNGFELMFEDGLAGTLAPGCPNYPSIVKPEAYSALYLELLVENDPVAREQLRKDLNKMAIDEYCLVIPQFPFIIENARQPYVHDYGYGLVASEWLPEIAWMSAH